MIAVYVSPIAWSVVSNPDPLQGGKDQSLANVVYLLLTKWELTKWEDTSYHRLNAFVNLAKCMLMDLYR